MTTKHKMDDSTDAPPAKIPKPAVDDFHAALSLLDDPALSDFTHQPSTSKESVPTSELENPATINFDISPEKNEQQPSTSAMFKEPLPVQKIARKVIKTTSGRTS
ncbi:hypothetical protein M3Y97_00345500 [Aphelenchoides bicaudatus]|nr:hypothetical protein M3Y97_00345500 [Aphelenchoides bicaudatus]